MNITRICLGGFALLALASAQPVAPSKSIDHALSGLEKDLVALAEAMPADKYDYAPPSDVVKGANFKGVRTFGQTIAHLAQAHQSLSLGVAGIAKPDEAQAAKMAAIGKMTSKADLVAALKDALAAGHKAIATLTPENAWDHAGRNPNETRAELAMYAVAHARDHYGQLVVYLRLNGLVPPASEGRPLANPGKTN